MIVAPVSPPRAPAPRRPRLDAVLALRYRHDHGVRVRCDYPFALVDDRLDIPYSVWKDWKRIRLHVAPDGDAPRTVLLLADLHGYPLASGRSRSITSVGTLDVDLVPARTGMAFSLVFAGPGNVATVRVFLRVPDDVAELFTLTDTSTIIKLPPPRVLEISRSWPLPPRASQPPPRRLPPRRDPPTPLAA